MQGLALALIIQGNWVVVRIFHHGRGGFTAKYYLATRIFMRDRENQIWNLHTKCSSSPKTSMEDIADTALANICILVSAVTD